MKNTLLYAKYDTVSVSSWNVHGLGQKHKDSFFLEYLNHDINILSETWKSDNSNIDIPKFNQFCSFRTKTKKAKRNSGGIMIYVKKEIQNGIEILKNITKSQNRIWLKLNKFFFGFDEDLYICGIYIPPHGSPHYDNEYEKLENEINILSKNGKILITGDFNSRTSNSPDFILNDENNEYLEEILPNGYISDFQCTRKTQDKNLNAQGRELLELCVSAKIRILNGRFIGDLLGNITCFNQRGCSVIDYAIASESLLSSVTFFQVQNPTPYSDHCQLITHLKCNSKIPKLQENYIQQNYKLKWTNYSKILLEKELTEKYIFETVANFQNIDFENNLNGVNMANNRISNIYINLSIKCMKKCYIKTKKKKKKSYWTNSQFLALRSTVNSYSKKMK